MDLLFSTEQMLLRESEHLSEQAKQYCRAHRFELIDELCNEVPIDEVCQRPWSNPFMVPLLAWRTETGKVVILYDHTIAWKHRLCVYPPGTRVDVLEFRPEPERQIVLQDLGLFIPSFERGEFYE